MLDNFFGSKARVKVLKIFLLNPEKKYYLRQLARDLNLQVNSVRRELINLEVFGLLDSAPLNNTIKPLPESTKKSTAKGKSAGGLKNAVGAGIKGRVGTDKSLVDAGMQKGATEIAERSTAQDKKYYQVNKNFVLFSEIKALILKAQILAGKTFVTDVKKLCAPRLLILSGIFVGNLSSPTDVLIVAKVGQDRLAGPIKKLEQELGREVNYTIMDENEFKYRQEIADVFLNTILEAKKIVLVNDFDFLF